jgi:hypothetical protein
MKTNFLRIVSHPRVAFLGLALAASVTLHVHAQTKTDIIGPVGSKAFGTHVVALPNGNLVVTDPEFGVPGGPVNIGAVYLIDGKTHAIISTLTGSSAYDSVGFGDVAGNAVTILANGDYVVVSQYWAGIAGAVTYCDADTGISGVVSSANSFVGSGSNQSIGAGGITPLTNGNYVISSHLWDDGSISNVGAVTLAPATGLTGVFSKVDSLVGTVASSFVGGKVTALSNGNYVVSSTSWKNADGVTVGAITFCNGTSALTGVVGPDNSLVSSASSGIIGNGSFGFEGVVPLPNGNYVVVSPNWKNQGVYDTGAVTFCNGTTGLSGLVSSTNSLVGDTANDRVGRVTVLANGHYVVGSNYWHGRLGAATFGHKDTGVTGPITTSNSLIGTTQAETGNVVSPLTNGNYVVGSPYFRVGFDLRGAATFCDGNTGRVGTVTSAMSLIGSASGQLVGAHITALTNGNYVVATSGWESGSGFSNLGAVTFGSGTTGIAGVVSAANSLVGSTSGDRVGEVVTALTNGDYVVGSPDWKGPAGRFGAITLANGTTGMIGTVSLANSMTTSSSAASIWRINALDNGNYVVRIPDNYVGLIYEAGTVTWLSGTAPATGEVSLSNSLVGTSSSDRIGAITTGTTRTDGLVPLPGGHYVVVSERWDNNTVVDAGAITLGLSDGSTVGEINNTNSILGADSNRSRNLSMSFDAVNNQFAVGRPFYNVVTLFSVPGSSVELPRLRIEHDPVSDQITLRWTAQSGRLYNIHSSPDLGAFTTPVLQNYEPPAANASHSFLRPASQMFYRLSDAGPATP